MPVRILHLARSWGGHDARRVSAWRSAGSEVVALAEDGSAPGQERSDEPFEKSIADAVATSRPDVIHAGPLTDVAWAAAHVWPGPLIATSWGFDLIKEVDESPLHRRRAQHVLQCADIVLVDNDAPARRAVALGADPQSLVHLPWGVDLTYFTPGPSAIRDRLADPASRVVLSTRRHEPIYHVDVVVNAFLRVADRWPLLRLVVAGGGSLTPHLRAVAENSRVADRVLFLGEVTHDQLRDAYRGADLYVSASSVDGTSVSLLEAMACGAAVCVSSIPGNAQWVTPSTGRAFPVGDVDALAQHLADLGRADPTLNTHRALQVCAASDLVRERADSGAAHRKSSARLR